MTDVAALKDSMASLISLKDDVVLMKVAVAPYTVMAFLIMRKRRGCDNGQRWREKSVGGCSLASGRNLWSEIVRYADVVLGLKLVEARGLESFVVESDCATAVAKVGSEEVDFCPMEFLRNGKGFDVILSMQRAT
ncbi:hypothetical protein M9H77_36348 [Catharanthus roseus]|uniref:Uncharacterized protein n=1 Tax=Catharanthus roseus TaxID=4058 RepID=A0ACB9ZRY2_CATRO|nr:hypothetical protein M9H77_36348 [Catharanthus roseus]